MFKHASVLAVLALVTLAAPLSAQNFATVTGSVADKTGAFVAGAKVSAQNLDTQVAREATANESGLYTIPLLPPGRSKVTVHKDGFRHAVQENVSLDVNQTVRLEFQLEVGQVTESVEVKASAPLQRQLGHRSGDRAEGRR